MDGMALRSDAERRALGVVVPGGMRGPDGLLRRYDWTDLDGNPHRSLSAPPKRRRRPRGMVLAVARTVGKGLVITGAVVGLLVAFGVVG